MKKLPRSLELRTSDGAATVYQRLMEWARDVVTSLKLVPDVSYVTVDVPSGGTASIKLDGRARSVILARVVTGTVTATPGIDWSPTAAGFDVSAVYGVSGASRIALRVEV
jgi:hypothetical protein